MGALKWIKKKMAMLALATASVEKDTLKQSSSDKTSLASQVQRHKQGTLSDALNRGELTQEVKDLRWRMYKVIDEAANYKTTIIGYDEDGFPITEMTPFTRSGGIAKVKMDEYDDYPLELVVNNDEITLGTLIDGIDEHSGNNIIKDIDLDGDPTATIGVISANTHESTNKAERVITCVRDFRMKFEIEKFTKKMNVRKISETERLLEFYVSKYPNEDDRRSNLFLSEIKKGINNPRICDFLEILGVVFVSYNTLGVKDLLDFEYKIIKFDKLIEFDGYYVIKFKAEVIKNGESLIEQFREEGLDEKYKNIERRKDR